MVYTVALFMSIMDTQIVNVALGTLATKFGANPGQIQWVVTGYLLTLAAAILASGWLGERLGTRRTFLIAIATFVAASGLCAASTTLAQLVVMRLLQGAAAGLMLPTGMAMLYRAYPQEQRIHISRLITLVAVIAPATAPLIGGVLVASLSWRWIFLVNVPIGGAALLFGLRFLPGDATCERPPRFDLRGFALAGGGLASFLYGLTQGPTRGWTSPAVLVCLIGGALALTAFIAHASRVEEPLLRLGLLRERLFLSCCTMMACGTTAFFGALVFTSLYLQEARGYSALVSGTTTFLEAVSIGVASQAVARIYPKVGPRRMMATGFGGLVLVDCLLASMGADTSLWLIRVLMLAIGASVAMAMLPLQTAAFAGIASRDTGHATAIFTTAQRAGGAVGVALLGAVLALGTHRAVKAPIHAFHAVYGTAAFVAAIGVIIALRVRDADAMNTMGHTEPAPEVERSAA